ncbi:hypothetical protein [Haliscomenobacter sp.]|uniref:hypothetical protein n=1 Tax=Haliscomenobacter sp. TaxID=2717303 RepID=UPI00359429D5
MAGIVREWCADNSPPDHYSDILSTAQLSDNPEGQAIALTQLNCVPIKVMRGGSFLHHNSFAIRKQNTRD